MENLYEVINNHKNLIYKLAHYFEKYTNKEDLFQVGCIGLIEAYKRYDKNVGAKFSTYAYPYILGEMKRYIREDKGIKISRNITKLNLKIEKARIILSQKLMRNPSTFELSQFLEIDEYLIIEALNTTNPVQSLDDELNDMCLYDTISIKERVDKDDLIELKNQLKNLNVEEQKLINYRYLEDYTQSETAKKLGMSQVQVSRFEQKVLKKLKSNMV
ncbi:MAG: sigma-70 family RNA polymerase sigma factor [Bacilli bacterium]|nr:sigma-70 family RNA polymerase sigma factor [Bacilli bacterium]